MGGKDNIYLETGLPSEDQTFKQFWDIGESCPQWVKGRMQRSISITRNN